MKVFAANGACVRRTFLRRLEAIQRAVEIAIFDGLERLPAFEAWSLCLVAGKLRGILALTVPFTDCRTELLDIRQVPLNGKGIAAELANQRSGRLAADVPACWTALDTIHLARLHTKVSAAYTALLDNAGALSGVDENLIGCHIPIVAENAHD